MILHKQFVIVQKKNGLYNIEFQTKTEKYFDKKFITVNTVDFDLPSKDAAKTRLPYFEDWKHWCLIRNNTGHIDECIIKEFDPYTETFNDLIKRYNLRCIDDRLDSYAQSMVMSAFTNGVAMHNAYKLKNVPIILTYFDGFLMRNRYYGNNFSIDEFIKLVRGYVDKVVNMYGGPGDIEACELVT